MSYEITDVTISDMEHDWQNEKTTYWFTIELDGSPEVFGLCDCNGDTQVLDCEGYPMTEGDHLTVYVRKAIEPIYSQYL